MKCWIGVVVGVWCGCFGMWAAAQTVEQIALNFGSDPSEMVVTWAAFSGKSGSVKYGSCDNLQYTATATSQTYKLGSYSSPVLYKAVMTGLKAGNVIYCYQVTSGGKYSSVYQFKSHPGVGAVDVEMAFHVVGDIGQTSNTKNTLTQVLDHEKALTGLSGGIINVGDLSYADGNQPLWDSFGNFKQFVGQSIPMMTTLGNHEWFDDNTYSFTAYLARFDNPPVAGKKEMYYSFDTGLVHWVMVAGYCHEMRSVLTQPCLAANSTQRYWLEADLKAVNRSVTPWVFVVFHQPYVNSNQGHSMSTEGKPMEAAIEDILYDNKVDMVFSGHVHAYERSCRVYRYVCTPDAPLYITIGDGGNREGLYDSWIEPQPAWSAFRQASYGYGELTVYNSTHVQWDWHQNADLWPEVTDTVMVVKGQAVENEPRTTSRPQFVEGERGRIAAKWNREMLVQYAEARGVNLQQFNL